MLPKEIEPFLRASLDDRRLSRGERRALRSIFDDWHPTSQQMAELRSIAFRIAEESLADPQAKQVMEWMQDVVQLLASAEDQPSASRADAFFSPGDECPAQIAGLFRTAKECADVCVFTITDDSITSAILDAHRRGIEVRIVTDDDKQFDHGSDVMRLRDAGVPVRTDRTDNHMHHKFAIFDRETLLTGSYNWTRSAARSNQENFIVTDDDRLVARFAKVFNDLWSQFG